MSPALAPKTATLQSCASLPSTCQGPDKSHAGPVTEVQPRSQQEEGAQDNLWPSLLLLLLQLSCWQEGRERGSSLKIHCSSLFLQVEKPCVVKSEALGGVVNLQVASGLLAQPLPSVASLGTCFLAGKSRGAPGERKPARAGYSISPNAEGPVLIHG